VVQTTVHYPETPVNVTNVKALGAERQITKMRRDARIPENQLRFDEYFRCRYVQIPKDLIRQYLQVNALITDFGTFFFP
jgi:hypothetical protein